MELDTAIKRDAVIPNQGVSVPHVVFLLLPGGAWSDSSTNLKKKNAEIIVSDE